VVATVDFKPEVLNLRSRGELVTVYVELPLDFSVDEIDGSTVLLGSKYGTVKSELLPVEVGDYDADGVPDFMVKFSRSATQAILAEGSQTITVTGDGSWFSFQGIDTIEAISP